MTANALGAEINRAIAQGGINALLRDGWTADEHGGTYRWTDGEIAMLLTREPDGFALRSCSLIDVPEGPETCAPDARGITEPDIERAYRCTCYETLVSRLQEDAAHDWLCPVRDVQTAYMVDTHVGAGSEVIACESCAAPWRSGPAEDCTALTLEHWQAVTEAEGLEPDRCEWCGQRLTWDVVATLQALVDTLRERLPETATVSLGYPDWMDVVTADRRVLVDHVSHAWRIGRYAPGEGMPEQGFTTVPEDAPWADLVALVAREVTR